MDPADSSAPQFISTREPGDGRRNGDRVATTILLAISAVIAAGMAFAGVFLVFITDSCGASTECDVDSFTTWWLVAMATPLVGVAATIAVSIFRMSKGRTAFWVPIAGTLIYGAAFAGVVALAFGAVN